MTNSGDTDLLQRLCVAAADYHGEPLRGDLPDAAVVVAVTRDAENPGLLLTRRAAHLKLHSSEVAFPGGKVDAEDASLLDTARREMHEEVGIAPRVFEPLAQLRQRVTRSHIRVTPFVGLIPDGLHLDINPGELESAFYTPLSELMCPQNFAVEQVQYQGRLREVAHFHIGEHDIWGVTAMVIADMLNTFLDAGLPIDVSQR